MRHCAGLVLSLVLLGLAPGLAGAEPPQKSASRGTPLYWCPNRPADQQISASAGNGCAPLAQPSAKSDDSRHTTPARPPIKMEQLQQEASHFLQRYNRFLECCADDVAELDQVRELEGEASHILASIQSSGIYNAGTVVRQYTLGEMVRQVAQSRQELSLLEARLDRIGKGFDKLDGRTDEESARAARELEADRAAIAKDFTPRRATPLPKAGVNIQDTTIPNWYGESPTGTSSLRSTTGTDIGQESGLATRAGDEARDSSLPDRIGTAGEASSLSSSTGFGIETHQNAGGRSSTRARVGPDLGDSSLNR